jgi:D-alanine-D-alanine ligase
MKRRRVLQLMHEQLVPPADLDGRTEAEVALYKTEYDVWQALTALGHEVVHLGLSDDLGPLRRALQSFQPHVVFNLLEEFRGEAVLDQNVVSYLELARAPYTGCGPRGLIIARDKALSKKLLAYHRIPVPRFITVARGRKPRRPATLSFPLIVKSQIEEASMGLAQASVVHSDDKLADRVAFVHEHVGTDAIVEQYIHGREFYVGVLGNRRLDVLPVWELDLRNLPADVPHIATRTVKFDLQYQERYDISSGPAVDLPPEVVARIVATSRKVFRALHLGGYARIDYRWSSTGQLYFLEANPNPDIAVDEEFASAAEAGAITYEALVQRIVSLGIRRGRE